MVKDQEFLEKKASYCLGLAKKLGATESSVIVNNSVSETVNFRNKKLDESNRSDDLGISITTYIGKKKSSISSSNLLDDNLNILIEKCVETTKNTPEDEFNSLPDKDLLAKEVKDLDLYDDTHIENDQKIDYLKKLELAASNDKKIVNYYIIELLKINKDKQFKKAVNFEKNRIEISFNENLDKDFIKNLSNKLYEWTSKRWIISLSKNQGQISKKEKNKIDEKKIFDDVKKSEAYKKVIEAFPDAELINVELKED